MTARLLGLTIGALNLTPAFDPDTLAYTATTANATNTVTAIPEAADAQVKITVGDVPVENGRAAWSQGENTVRITVTSGADIRTYTVTVTR